VKWRGVKVSVRFLLINSLRYLIFSSIRAVFAVFGWLLHGFRSVADPRSSTRLQIVFTEHSFQPFSGNFATIVRYLKPRFRSVDRSELYAPTIFTDNQSYKSATRASETLRHHLRAAVHRNAAIFELIRATDYRKISRRYLKRLSGWQTTKHTDTPTNAIAVWVVRAR